MNMKKIKTYFMTGLPGSGKTTIATETQNVLKILYGVNAIVLDGDRLRAGINIDLDFTEQGRTENIRRTAEITKLFMESEMIPIVSTVTPTNYLRELARKILKPENVCFIWIKCDIETCIQRRSQQGLYENLKNEPGIINPRFFETPDEYDLVINTDTSDISDSVDTLIQKILQNTRHPYTSRLR